MTVPEDERVLSPVQVSLSDTPLHQLTQIQAVVRAPFKLRELKRTETHTHTHNSIWATALTHQWHTNLTTM